ncbi:SDR family oxidoreductase [Sinanaerobacter chloroacetimidivorans]|uniref:SDR family oxidoreductase n=1 Tax=Sinanaerobacter chloroacetimidivorans TaxID=2818044 RepID=A0A8J7W1H7_9FIRM|nr:SDR family oxidoreductase [Sinanaerobacter chloroacetimidivorans]MBR0597853.1 SDR family oxidoreductase [Sinanaerobacter chloroacetimidivorans]
MMELFNIRGKKAIVTGGSRGLGKGMAQGLHDAGVELVLMGTNETVITTAKEMDSSEARTYGVIADFKEEEDVRKAFYEALEFLGDIDILVNNAGMQIRHPSVEFPLRDWELVLAVNLTSVFLLSQLAGKIMLEKNSGKIINIASLLSFSGGYTVPAYAASKGGIAQLTKALSNEWAAGGINVNAIAPGYMDTDNTAEIKQDPKRYAQILERIPAGRWGSPDDLIGALIFLSSQASDYVNGSILSVDGGWMGR